MKFAWKIFFVSFIMIIVSFGIGGFLLINAVFTSSLEEKTSTLNDNNSYITLSLYATCSNADTMGYGENSFDYIINNFLQQVSGSSADTEVKIGNATQLTEFDDITFITAIDKDMRSHRIAQSKGRHYFQAVSHISISNRDLYVETLTDISEIYFNRDSYCGIFRIILLIVAMVSSLVLVLFSKFLTRPLVKLSDAAKEIAGGNFSKRVEMSSTGEVRELSESFNTMAENIESYTDKLKKAAQDRDDFVANFTHELKTPLTSVIGYADMLRTYELDADKRRECADYIYREGKRLEKLSANLLEIIVMENSDIKCMNLYTEHLIKELRGSVAFLLKKYGLKLHVKYEKAYIFAEPSLLKTLLYNLIDNACKASQKGQGITLFGKIDGDRYRFSVADCGRGIPKAELEKIIQPFYMIDKSRSRKMGGAGLGLALCNEIARLHNSKLTIESKESVGTTVQFDVAVSSIEREGESDENES